MLDQHPTEAEVTALVAQLDAAGLLEVCTDDQGCREAYRLTDDGTLVGHMLAMAEGREASTVLDAFLGHEKP